MCGMELAWRMGRVVEKGDVLVHELFEAKTANTHDQRALDAPPAAAGQHSADAGSDAEQHEPKGVAEDARFHL